MEEKYKKIWQLALPYLKKGKRKDFVTHTEGVIKAMEMILKKEKGSRDLLIPAAILHDVGWAKVPVKMQKSWMDKKQKIRGEQLHLKYAVPIVAKILEKTGYKKDEIKEITGIILAHKFSDPKNFNKQLLVDADNLANSFKDQFYADAKAFKVTMEIHYNWRRNDSKLYTKTAKKIFNSELEKRRKEIEKAAKSIGKEKLIGGVAVIKRSGKYLLIKQALSKPNGGQWRFPGGRFKKDEDCVLGIKREIKEELGIDIKTTNKNPVFVTQSDYQSGLFGFYPAEIIRGKIKVEKGEVAEVKWIKPADIDKFKIMDASSKYFKEYCKLL